MITKTKFKNYARCSKFFNLEKLKTEKENTFLNIDKEEIIEFLKDMFGENDEDLIDVSDEYLKNMLPYFTKVETTAKDIVAKYFQGKITYSVDTLKQKSFSCFGENHKYICYTDIYLERDHETIIFEVKATTTNKFDALSYTSEKEKNKIFQKIDNTYRLKDELDSSFLTVEKYLTVRSKLFDKYHTVGKYVYDLAIQRWIVENYYQENGLDDKIKNTKYYLVALNHEYIFDGLYLNGEPVYREINGQEIISFIDLTKITEEYQTIIGEEVLKVEKYLSLYQIPNISVNKYCERNKTTQCKYFNICWNILPKKNSILTYMYNHKGFGSDDGDDAVDIFDLISAGVVHALDIPRHNLSRKINLIQRDCIESDKVYLKKNKINLGLRALTFPIYHLDFESFPCPLPRFKGEKAYSQSVFQYSLHVQKNYFTCDKNSDHLEFLSTSSKDLRKELVEKLISELGTTGSIVVWNKSFEETRMKEFQLFYPEYAKKIDNIIDRIFDLMHILKGNTKLYQSLGLEKDEAKGINYYHVDLQGSYSIKKVLPIFSTLTYNELEVSSGLEAVSSYITLMNSPSKTLEKSLIEYCKQDSWAMVEILDNIKKIA